MKLLEIRIVAKRCRELASNFKMSLSTTNIEFFNSLISTFLSEKKATSEPEIKAEQN